MLDERARHAYVSNRFIARMPCEQRPAARWSEHRRTDAGCSL